MLQGVVRRIRQRALEELRARGNFAAWRERDFLHGESVDAGVVVLSTRGCAWALRGGCTMCGYVYDSSRQVGQEEVLQQLRQALAGLEGVAYLKVFNSGSFFDPGEIAPETRREIYRLVNSLGVERLQVESRPEYISREVVEEAVALLEPELEVGIGLETTSDYIREVCINKGFTLAEFARALEVCRGAGAKVKAYLLIKPPFLTEAEAIEDAVRSALKAARMGVSRLSFNPVNVQRGTLVEELFKRGEYRPPWLWSVVEVVRRVKARVDIPVVCSPSGAGTGRGASNCGRCDARVVEALRSFSATQEMRHLEELSCACKRRWREELALEVFLR
ncbi:MAG: archaeosine biosynthesis radical SAM protein RaSEA [Euryarchaeota archaeon]|nr:archaeosine biosynthesis radical SAM protein RaSEA [Euryarchaeota archaeon]